MYADIADSIYYAPSDLEVWLQLVDNQTGDVSVPFLLDLVGSSDLDKFSLSKLEGVFNVENHFLYKIK